MKGPSTHHWVRYLRRILLASLFLFLVGLIGLYMFGRATEPVQPPELVDDGAGGGVETLLASEGWEYEVSSEGQPVFTIRGERMLSDRQDNVVLEGVGLTLYQDNGDSWDLECERGSYNRETEEATLEGNVRAVGSMGLSLSADGFTVGKGGRVFRSTSGVHFEYLGQYEGRADGLSVNLRTEFYLLSGKVEIHSLPGAATTSVLRSGRLAFDGEKRLVRALGNVRLEYGASWLEARRFSAVLTEDHREIRFIRALGVSGANRRLRADGLPETLSIGAATLSLVLDADTGEVSDLELEGRARRLATVTIADDTGLARQIQARYIVGHDLTPASRTFRAYEPVAFREFFTFAPRTVTAWACADRADFRLDHNQLVAMHLDGNSEFQRDSLFAGGDTVELDTEGGSTTLSGQPARVLAQRGELEAPAIVRIHHSGEIQAHGGIKGRMYRDGSALAGGEGPLQIEAEELVWSETPQKLLLRGTVRAWQGQQLLIADELEENVDRERLEARGNVRTVWTPDPEPSDEQVVQATTESIPVENPPQPPATAAESPTEVADDERFAVPTSSREPLEVTAQSAVYDRLAGLVTYAGGSRARQGQRSLVCEELELELTESGEAERMLCREGVVIRDGVNKRTVRGDLANYEPEASEVRVSGERVTLKAEDGTTMVGPVMIYDFESGKARVESESLLDIDPSMSEDDLL